MLRLVLGLQGLYYFTTGVWPLVHMPSFEWVTGPKIELWLVRTVGVLVLVVGLVLMLAARKRNATLEVMVLAAGCAVGLLLIDVVYVFTGVIPPIYLADAVAQVAILLGLFIGKVRAGATLDC
jgi:hypothetical protein